jgi:hypothetical protein
MKTLASILVLSIILSSCHSPQIKLTGKWQILKDTFGRDVYNFDPSLDSNKRIVTFINDEVYELSEYGRTQQMNYRLTRDKMYISKGEIGRKSDYYNWKAKSDSLEMFNKKQYYLLKRMEQ